MCLYTKQICPLRARKDIVCYKIVRYLSECLFQTPFQGYVIQGPLPVTLQIDNKQGIDKLESAYYRCLHYRRTIFGGMFHACTNLAALYTHRHIYGNEIVVKCTIPKGTLYYKGIRGDICARTLILQEIICGNQDNL